MFKQLILVIMTALFCGSCSKKEPLDQKKPTILVTIAPYAFFADKIAGDTLDVETLIPPKTNLHIYEPSPKSIEKNSKAVIWFRIDEPIEKKIVEVFKERHPKMLIVNLQEGVPLLHDDGAVELTPCQGHDHDRDLHTWMSPKFALKQAQVIAEQLIKTFPEHKDLYQKNFNDLTREMLALEKEISTQLAPFKGNAILVSHPAFGYFCKDYGLLQLSVECEGKDPKPRDVEQILKNASKYHVRCVFLQQGFNNRGAQLIGKKLQLPNYQIDPYAKNYLTNMRQISGYIAK